MGYGSGRRSENMPTEKNVKNGGDLLSRGKLIFLGIIFTACIAALLTYVGYVKNVHGDEYERMAVIQAYHGRNNVEQTITPVRGSILDRNRQPLAVSDTVYTLVIDVRTLAGLSQEEINETVNGLAELTGATLEEMRGYLATNDDGSLVYDTRYKEIRKSLPRRTAGLIREASLKCVYLVDDTKREYVDGLFAPQIIGFQRDNSTANWGLESRYNEEMTGEAGRVFRRFDEDANPVTQEIPAKPGYSLITTIDSAIQRFAQDTANEAGRLYEPEYASIVIMDPNTCEIYAMAQYPSFDNNNPTDPEFFTDRQIRSIWEDLEDEEQANYLFRNWINFNISRSFEPGSIFKPFVVAAALEENLIGLHSNNFYCGGKKQVLDRELPCWIDSYFNIHGNQTLTQVIANSCNIAMIEINQILGRDLFYKYRCDFGFGEKTGIDLPGEESVSSPLVMYTRNRLNPVEMATSSFGQGFNATAIQSMTAFAALINGGNLMRPYVVSQIIDADGNVVRENKPETVRKVISKQTSDQMREMLHEVVTPEGTGKRAVIPGYTIGGKTGTAQQGKDRDKVTVSFMAFLPVENPQFLALAIIDKPREEGHQGSTSAAPMLQEVMLNLIKYKNIPQSEESDYNVTIPSDAVGVPDYGGMQLTDATRSLNNYGFDYTLTGSGATVTGQFPAPGQQATPGSMITLYIAEGEEDELEVIPSAVGLDVDEAVDILTRSGFVPVLFYETQSLTAQGDVGEPVTVNPGEEDQTDRGDANIQGGTVYEQMPVSANPVQKGIQVKLKIR